MEHPVKSIPHSFTYVKLDVGAKMDLDYGASSA